MFTKIVFGKCPVKILATRNNLSMISSYKNMSVMSAYRTRLAGYKGVTFERTTNLKSHHIRYTCDPFSHTIHLFFTQFIDMSDCECYTRPIPVIIYNVRSSHLETHKTHFYDIIPDNQRHSYVTIICYNRLIRDVAFVSIINYYTTR